MKVQRMWNDGTNIKELHHTNMMRLIEQCTFQCVNLCLRLFQTNMTPLEIVENTLIV